MLTYLSKRIALFIPTLFGIALVAFWLSRLAPGDPAQALLGLEGLPTSAEWDTEFYEREYQSQVRRLGLDKPPFYFSIQPSHFPDTLHRIGQQADRKRLRQWLQHGWSWPAIQAFEARLADFGDTLYAHRNHISKQKWSAVITGLKEIRASKSKGVLRRAVADVHKWTESEGPVFLNSFRPVSMAMPQMWAKKRAFFKPAWVWHGRDNQFHAWISKLLRGDFGVSLADGRPAVERIAPALSWTFFLVVWTLLISLLLAIPLSVYASLHPQSWAARFISAAGYAIYAIPLFWLATLLVIFFTTDEYGSWLHWFPSVGANYVRPGSTFFEKAFVYGQNLILPILCLTLHSLVYLLKQLKTAMAEEQGKLYYRTGLAKGLSLERVQWRHVLPNSILPIITLLVDAFPAAMVGSVVIEVIFNIPGMGRLLFHAIESADWTIVYTILLLVGVFTVVSYLIGDILYSYFNPRIRLTTKGASQFAAKS